MIPTPHKATGARLPGERPPLGYSLLEAIRGRLKASQRRDVAAVQEALAEAGVHLTEAFVAEWINDINNKEMAS